MAEYIVNINEEEVGEFDFIAITTLKEIGIPVVRCKDCKAYLPETETLASYCEILRIYSLPEDAYCYKAQRKNNDQS